MLASARTFLVTTMLVMPAVAFQQSPTSADDGPQYTSDAQLKYPEHYREWVYLTSGFDMSYSANMQMGDHHVFDNVFVNPESYRAFVKSGTWPDKTLLVLEVRDAQGKGSINQKGNYQSGSTSVEVHVKDEARFPGKWAFFSFDEGRTSRMIPVAADCYSCHAAHAAVDTTFVQFYPTLLPIATSKATLSAAYLKESGTRACNSAEMPAGHNRAGRTMPKCPAPLCSATKTAQSLGATTRVCFESRCIGRQTFRPYKHVCVLAPGKNERVASH